MSGITRIAAFLMAIMGLGLAVHDGADGLCGAEVPAKSTADSAILRIEIRQDALVNTDRIYLKDVAVIHADRELQEKVGAIDLGTAPKPGRTRTLPGSWIASYLRSGNRIPDTAQVTVFDQLHVVRASQVISEKRLRSLLEASLAANANGADWRLRRFKVRGQTVFPTGKVDLKAASALPRGAFGNVNLRVMVLIDGKESGRISLSGWVDRFEKAVCAARFLPRDTVLSADDLRMASVNLAKAPADLMLSMDEVIGKRLTHQLAAGLEFRAAMLEAPPLIYKGDRVKLVAQSGALRVVTLGIAKTKGAKGDQIQVENLNSKKTVVGRVADRATVEVLF